MRGIGDARGKRTLLQNSKKSLSRHLPLGLHLWGNIYVVIFVFVLGEKVERRGIHAQSQDEFFSEGGKEQRHIH